MSKHTGPAPDDQQRNQAPVQRTVDSIFNAFEATIIGQLVKRPDVPNRLNSVQALRERLAPDADHADMLTHHASEQALLLSGAKVLEAKFKAKQNLYEYFIAIVRSKIAEPKITPEHIKGALLALKQQFFDKDQARQAAMVAQQKVDIATKEVQRLEAEAAKASPAASSANPAPNQTSSASTKPAISPLEIAKSALESLKKAAEEANTAAQKQTDIPMMHKDAFITFVTHALHVLPFMVQELQFGKPDDKLTKADCEAATLSPIPTKKRDKVTARLAKYEPWKSAFDDKTTRTGEVKGAAFRDLPTRVQQWFNPKELPRAMSTEEMHIRKQIGRHLQEGQDIEDISDIIAETPKQRKVRRELIDGFRKDQIKEMAVAQSKAPKNKLKTAPVAKQPHEVEDSLRAEFKELGIKPYSYDEQSAVGMLVRVGGDCYEEFANADPRSFALDEGAPRKFPERRDLAKKTLTPALQRHLELGVKKGYLVGEIKDVTKDKYWEPVKDSDEMTAVISRLGAIKI